MKNILITSIGCAPASAIARSLKYKYNIIGIDMLDTCVGNYICDKFICVPYRVDNPKYWENIESIIINENIIGVFITTPNEAYEWSLRKNKYKCEIYLNDPEIIDTCNCKRKTIDFCIKNDITIPSLSNLNNRPIIIKPINGCGSKGIQILKNSTDIYSPFNENDNIIQEFIEGDEYTVDVLSDLNSNIIAIVPKKRLLVKNGQSYKSIIEKDFDVISFVSNVTNKLKNKSVINVQVIKQKNTNKIYLIEINPRFPTTLSLTIQSGIHMPEMLIEKKYYNNYIDNLMMVRDYKEYFSIEKKYKIFLTGGAGFIGSNIVKLLLEKNYNITVYDNLSTVNCGLNNIQSYIDTKKINFINGDILDKNLLFVSMKDHDIVIHMAAQLEITTAYKNQLHDLNINLIGTLNIIESCIKNNIKRLINASSACIYGFTNGLPSKENDNTNPNWEYGISKLAAEKYIQISGETHGLLYTNLRFSIVYGINEWYGRVLTIFTKRAIEGKNLIIFGDGNQVRDYINVKDVARFVIECIINPNTYNKNYNVSSGVGIRVRDLAEKIINIYPNLNIIYDNVKEGEISKLVEGRERLNQELRYMLLDNTKALMDTNWKPIYDFDDELPKYIEWAKNNLKYWNYIKA